ncbi:MAG TPA: PadR family transcriptional regulator [Conexibacter sp.]|nr:PadR family transcriptional regulator [Conexibacter sp.]
MSVKHAVLGLVIERPGYGYELIQRLEQRIEGWRPSETAVYPALRSLRSEGMIRAREATADGTVVSAHRGVVWYEATETGREEFRAWVRAPTDLAPQRDPFWLKVAFASPEDLPHLVELARELESACLERMAELSEQGDSVDDLRREDVEWRDIGQAWLRRTEAAQLSVRIEAVQQIRAAMKRAIQRRERGRGLALAPPSEPDAR